MVGFKEGERFYVRRATARLAMGEPLRVGLALDVDLLFKNHSEIFAGVQRFAGEAGWLTVIDDWIEGPLDQATCGHRGYDGIIARIDCRRMGLVKTADEAGVPLVKVLASSPALKSQPSVCADMVELGALQAEHLLARGLRHFACLSVKDRPDEDRLSAFEATVKATGHKVSALTLPVNWKGSPARHRRCRARIHAWMNRWKLPVGVATADDYMSRLLAQMAHERGWLVPDDVAIIGARNEEHLCERPRPLLSSVEIGFERIGYEAAKMLDRLMRGEKVTSVSRIALPPIGVVARESTDRYAADDPLVAEAQAFIAQHCHTSLEVTDVAAQLCVSSKTLQLHFAAALQRSVAAEIRRVRIENAKRDLATSDLSIHEIALRAGFTSNVRLCEVFRRYVGMAPSEFRGHRNLRKA